MPVEEASPAAMRQQAQAARAAMRQRIRASQNGVLAAGTLMAVSGWLGLYVVVFSVPPLALYRWLLFILLYMAITGTLLPFIWYLNRRFSGGRLVMGGTILREGIFCGLYAITLAWLQMVRAFNPILAVFLAAIFIAIEIFLRIRERQNL
jgi:hypothetical protein